MGNTLESFVDMLHENSNADYVTTNTGETILLVKSVEESIQEQVKEPGDGPIFAKAWKLEELKSSLEKLNPQKGKKIYEGKLHNAGYDLVLERKEVVPFKKLVGYSEDKKLVESQTRRIANIPQHIEKFKTDKVTYFIRPVGLDEAIRNFTEFEDDANKGRLFILEDVKIGPYRERWSDDLYVIIPNK